MTNHPSTKILISPAVFLAYVPISVVAIILALYEQVTRENLWQVMYISLSATSLSALLVLLLNSTWLLRQKVWESSRLQNIAFIVAAMLVGIFRGLMIFVAIENSSFIQPTPLISRVLTSTANVVFWLYLLDKSLAETGRYSQRYLSAVRTLVLKRARSVSSRQNNDNPDNPASVLTPEQEKEFKNFQRSVIESIDPVTRGGFTTSELARSAAMVRTLIEEKLRPLSKKIYLSGLEAAPKFRKSVAIKAALSQAKFDPFLASYLLTLCSSINLISTFDLISGFKGTVVTFVASGTIFAIVQKLNQRRRSQSLIVGLLLHLIPGLGIAMVFTIYNNLVGIESLTWENLVFAPVSSMITVFLSTIYLSKLDRTKILELLDDSLKEIETTKFQSGLNSQEIASYLHNSLQSELLALSLQAESSARNSDDVEIRTIVERLVSRMNRSLADNFMEHRSSLDKRVEQLASSWLGIAVVQMNVPTGLLNEIENGHLVVEMIDEAISNAVRHQNADHVDVTLERLNGRIQIRIESWGRGLTEPEVESQPGLGSKLLDLLARGEWHREVSDKRTTLVINLN